MRILRLAAAILHARPIICSLAILYGLASPLAGQNTPAQPAAAPAAPIADSAPKETSGILNLDGPWRFQQGDDLEWALPGFDDSNWPSVNLSQPLSSQGIDPYTGYAWYRLHLQPQQLGQFSGLSAKQATQLLVSSESVGQLALYVNGVEVGQTQGMTERPSMYLSPPFAVQLSAPDAAGARVLAIRTWAGPTVTVQRGLVGKLQFGTSLDIADQLALANGRQWNEHAISGLFVAFLFLGATVLGTALYFSQRSHSEYLWLALLCISVAAEGAADAAFGLALVPLSIYRVFAICTGRIFMVITLEFVFRFTAGKSGSKSLRTVRIAQGCFLLLPVLYFVQLIETYEIFSVAAEVVFCSMVCVLLFRAWRKGQADAGVMLLPFFFAASADSADTVLDYAALKSWLPQQFASHRFHVGPIEYGTGTLAYLIFLTSIVAVILYRFVRVSEEEQRSAAEISAARSVQALLIPTQLPSNRSFMLESAYLPVNGVGGDFFQALPLKDDSLLIVVGDVSGKGLQAAMNSSTLVGALRNELSHDPGTILNHLNHVLLGAVPSPGAVPGLDSAPCFATCLCARVYPDGAMTIANAGHLSPYRDGRELELPPGLPLGVIADSQYEETTFQLSAGDRLVFLSDGVVEATNSQGELFGFERTQQVSHEPARYIAQIAQRFGQTDDITVVSLYLVSCSVKRSSGKTVLAN
jgi:hypothetical protein